jgi:hypothetical protein
MALVDGGVGCPAVRGDLLGVERKRLKESTSLVRWTMLKLGKID